MCLDSYTVELHYSKLGYTVKPRYNERHYGQAGVAVHNLIRDCGEAELSVWPVWDQNVLHSVWTEPSARGQEAPRGRHAGGRGPPAPVQWTRQSLGRRLQGGHQQ